MGCTGQRTPLAPHVHIVLRTVLPPRTAISPPRTLHAELPAPAQDQSVHLELRQPHAPLRTHGEPHTYQVVRWSSHRTLRPFPCHLGTNSAPSSSLHTEQRAPYHKAALDLPCRPRVYLPNNSPTPTPEPCRASPEVLANRWPPVLRCVPGSLPFSQRVFATLLPPPNKPCFFPTAELCSLLETWFKCPFTASLPYLSLAATVADGSLPRLCPLSRTVSKASDRNDIHVFLSPLPTTRAIRSERSWVPDGYFQPLSLCLRLRISRPWPAQGPGCYHHVSSS